MTVDPASGRYRRLTHSPKSEAWPSWAPDGRRIVYSSRPRGSFDQDLFIRRDDGSKRRLTRGPARDFFPRWSPAGGRILFIRVYPKRRDVSSFRDTRTIMIVRPDGSNLHRVLAPRRYRGELTAGWGPHGRRVIFTVDGRPRASTNLYVMGRRGRGLRRVTHVDHAAYSLPDWSPDGRSITYSSYGAYERDVGLVGRDGRGRMRLSPNDLIDPHGSVWSPDGRRIAYVASGTGCGTRLYIAGLAQKRVRNPLRGIDVDVEGIDW